jgi:FkbM family methyltransferase
VSYRLLKSLLDRPGGRKLLGRLVTRQSCKRWREPVEIFYDGCWIHRFGNEVVARPEPQSGFNLTALLSAYKKLWLRDYEIQPGDTIIDVGAGIGVETILFSRAVGADGKVLSIEAQPKTFDCLTTTCNYNKLENVVPINVAVSDSSGEVLIEDTKKYISNSIAPDGSGSIRIPARRLDELCKQHDIHHVGLLKMNIEGAERFAIQGMETMMPAISRVVIACHDFKADRTGNEFFRTKNIVSEFLMRHGFQIQKYAADKAWEQDHVHALNPNFGTR